MIIVIPGRLKQTVEGALHAGMIHTKSNIFYACEGLMDVGGPALLN